MYMCYYTSHYIHLILIVYDHCYMKPMYVYTYVHVLLYITLYTPHTHCLRSLLHETNVCIYTYVHVLLYITLYTPHTHRLRSLLHETNVCIYICTCATIHHTIYTSYSSSTITVT